MSNESSRQCPQCGAPLNESAAAGLCPNCVMALNLQTETVLTGDAPANSPPLPPAEIAPHFPQLEILRCLGRGGMGVVYQARQKSLNRFVALKLLAPERVNDPKFAERFAREAQALAALNHPNIVTVYDFGQAGGFYFLLMEFVDGVNLRQLLRERKFTPEEALAIVPPLCDALQFAHERGIVHRDIKPENLLLDKTGRVKIADFGIAKMLGNGNGGPAGEPAAPENATRTAVGTRGYSAPEQQAAPQKADSRADIYSLGVVFYEMLTGELPGKRIEPPSRKVQIDVRLDQIVLRALEKTPELRWQTAAELRTQVETLVATPQPALETKRASTERQGGAGVAPVAARTNAIRAAPFGLILAVISAILAAVSFRAAPKLILFWSILPTALAGIAVGVWSRRSAEGKAAIAVGLVAALIWLAIGCSFPVYVSHSSHAAAEFHYRVLDADPALVDRLIPASQRRPGVQPNAQFFGGNRTGNSSRTMTYRSAETNYTISFPIYEVDGQLAEIGDDTLEALLNDVTAAPALENRTREVTEPWWRPGMVDTWIASEQSHYTASSDMSYGVRYKSGALEARLECFVDMALDVEDPVRKGGIGGFRSRFLYEGKVQPHGALAFLVPFQWPDGTSRYLVIAYEIRDLATVNATMSEPTPAPDAQIPDVPVPKAVQLSTGVDTNQLSALLYHDDATVHYVFLYAGSFTLSAKDWSAPNGPGWRDEGRITLTNGCAYNYLRSSAEPSTLQVTGSGFQLSRGRVFVLHDDGTLEQFRLFPSLAQARDIPGLAQLVHSHPESVALKREASQVYSRAFLLQHKVASEIADRLGDILQNRRGCKVTVDKSNRRILVVAPPDLLNRVSTFIAVEDWPDPVQDTPAVEAAKRFFRECSRGNVERVSRMLSADVLAELAGTNLMNTVGAEAAAADVALTRQLHGDWPGKEAAIRKVIEAYNRYPLGRIRHDDGGPNASIVFGYMPVIEFESAPTEFGRMTFASDAEYGTVINRLPPWFGPPMKASHR